MGPSHKSITKPQHQLCFNQFSSNHPQIKHHNVFSFILACNYIPSSDTNTEGGAQMPQGVWSLLTSQREHKGCSPTGSRSTDTVHPCPRWAREFGTSSPHPASPREGPQPQKRPHRCFASAGLSLKAKLQPCTKEGRGRAATIRLLSAFSAGLKITISLWSMFF